MRVIRTIVNRCKSGDLKPFVLSVLRAGFYHFKEKADYFKDTHFDAHLGKCGDLKYVVLSHFDQNITNVQQSDIDNARAFAERYLAHKIDLLGSGWVNISLPGEDLLLHQDLHKTCKRRAAQIDALIDEGYHRIDWQKDFKSGYVWGADRWYRPQQIPGIDGVDIKVPWELSRLQHLPRLALLAMLFPDKESTLFREFRNQLLDFIAYNPPRWGVNHMCTMDVGIRTANIALACSLWKSMEIPFDTAFESTVSSYLYDECQFIRENLEWSYYLTSNHYFADIAGLLWGSAMLPDSHRKTKWLRFAAHQLEEEIIKQFHAEGSNGEGSTAYHRLTGEMALYSVALIHGLSKQGVLKDVDARIYSILRGAGHFSADITRPDGMFTQIGDNDSGLFFKLSLTGIVTEDGEPDECLNDAAPFISAVYGMFNDEDLAWAGEKYPTEHMLVQVLMGGATDQDAKQEWLQSVRIGRDDYGIEGIKKNLDNLSYSKTHTISCPTRLDLKSIQRIDYPAFGLVIFKSSQLYLCVCLADNGQKGNAGHAHNDKLSFELFLDGKCIFEDPGTYVYTPYPELRDRFRSTQYHNTIWCGEEQNRYNGMFSMYNDTVCTVTDIGATYLEGQVTYRGIVHRRRFEIREQSIQITDWCNREFRQQFVQQKVARGYGKMEA